jgi:hypothetical protein
MNSAGPMAQLDDYEGVNVAFDETKLYQREIAEVHIDNRITNAWMYWYVGDVQDKPVIDSGDVPSIYGTKRNNLFRDITYLIKKYISFQTFISAHLMRLRSLQTGKTKWFGSLMR